MTKEEKEKLSNLFSMFSDPTRLSILEIIKNEPQNVTTITKEAKLTISNVSHQLKLLEQQRLVKKYKEGKYVYYLLDDDHVFDILNKGLEHIKE